MSMDMALAGQVLVWLVVIVAFLLSRQASVYHPLTIYLGFHTIVFVVRPLLVYYLNFNHEFLYMGLYPDTNLLEKTLMVSSFGLVVFAITSLGFGWCSTNFKHSTPRLFTLEQRRGLLFLAIILSPVIAYSIEQSHTNYAMENRGGVFVSMGAGGYTIEAQYMAGPLVCAFILMARFRWYAVAFLIPYVGYRAFSGMSRWTFVLLFVALGLVYAWHKRLKWVSPWLFVFVIPIFFVFKTIGDDRLIVKRFFTGEQYVAENKFRPGSTSLEQFRQKYDGPDFANFDFLAFVVAAVPERTGTYTYGVQYLQLFTEPIPRKLWPDKPAGAPIGFFNLNNYGDFLGRTVSLVGDGWMSGGWVGVFVTLSMVGALLGLAHRWFWRHSENNMVALFYLVGLAMLPQWFRDGGISISKFIFWNLSPLALWSGITWLSGPRMLPGYSRILPRGTQVRFVPSVKNKPGRGAANPGSNLNQEEIVPT